MHKVAKLMQAIRANWIQRQYWIKDDWDYIKRVTILIGYISTLGIKKLVHAKLE